MATSLYKGNEEGSTFSSSTLMHNWWEDRQNPSSTGAKAGTSTFQRVFHKSPGDHAPPSLFSTTKKAADEDMLESKERSNRYFEHSYIHEAKIKADATTAAPVAVSSAPDVRTVCGRPQHSRLYSGSFSLDERMATYGRPPALAYSLPPTAGKQAEEIETTKRIFDGTTTNKMCYQDLPAAAKSSPPKQGYYDAEDTRHRKTMQLEREREFYATGGASTVTGRPFLGTSTAKSAGSGRGGALGEFTRNPKEAGSVYGVSVWSDEYSQWASKLAGMSLGETRSRAMTKYF